jgi:4-hydroxy-tetrahydrodipicolinate synthase
LAHLSMTLGGIIPTIFSPFSPDGRALDEDALRQHIEWLIAGGVHGLLFCGTYGEAVLLTTAERKQVADIAVHQTRQRIPVLIQTGSITTQEAIELTRHAQEAGADGVAMVTPWYYAWDDQSLYAHYAATAAAVPGFPLFLYNLPGYTGNTIKPALAARLAEAYENIAGVKDSSKDLTITQAFITALGPGYRVFVGTDSLVFPALSMGAAGVVSAVADIFPDLMVNLYNAYWAADFTEARRLQYRVNAARDAMKGPAGVMLYKKALELRGLPAGGHRPPARPVTGDEEARLRSALEKLELL